MKIAPIDDWPVLADFYEKLARDLHARGIKTLTTGGAACVVYSLAQNTKDCDLIIPVSKVKDVLEVLAHTQLQGHACHLTLKYGAPFDERWFNGGWSSHTYFGAPARPMARVDFFGNPPRLRTLDPDENPLVLCRDGVARMKKSRREKDWAFANLLGEQMLLRGDPAGLLHITDPRRLVSAVHKTQVIRSLLAERPLLQLAVSGSPELTRYIKAEKDFWAILDDLRLKAYENAWLPYGTAIQKETWLLHMSLKEQNTALVKIAEKVLDQDPLATVGWHNLVHQAKEETMNTFHDLNLDLLPNPHSFFGRRDGGVGEDDPEL